MKTGRWEVQGPSWLQNGVRPTWAAGDPVSSQSVREREEEEEKKGVVPTACYSQTSHIVVLRDK